MPLEAQRIVIGAEDEVRFPASVAEEGNSVSANQLEGLIAVNVDPQGRSRKAGACQLQQIRLARLLGKNDLLPLDPLKGRSFKRRFYRGLHMRSGPREPISSGAAWAG